MSAVMLSPTVEEYLKRLPPAVRKELRIATPQSLGQSHLLHISKDTAIAEFVPSVSRRTLDLENRSIARVSTAPTVAGCLLGYCSDIYDFMNRQTTMSGDRQRKVPFRGGWVIYGIPFDHALRPTKKLLPDVDRTDEHWLVALDEDSAIFKPDVLGKLFYQQVTYQAGGKRPLSTIDMAVEVLTDTPIQFDAATRLTRGCWRLKVTGLEASKNWKTVKVEASAYPRNDFIAAKRLCASTLSFEDLSPRTAQW